MDVLKEYKIYLVDKTQILRSVSAAVVGFLVDQVGKSDGSLATRRTGCAGQGQQDQQGQYKTDSLMRAYKEAFRENNMSYMELHTMH